MKLKCDKTSEIVREMTDSEKAESIIKLINDYDINSTFLFGWQIEFIEKLCRKQLNNGWIPVSERLPTDEESKLYRGEFIIQTKDCELPYVSLWNRIKGIWQDDYEELDDVIAWQPLPDKYKK